MRKTVLILSILFLTACQTVSTLEKKDRIQASLVFNEALGVNYKKFNDSDIVPDQLLDAKANRKYGLKEFDMAGEIEVNEDVIVVTLFEKTDIKLLNILQGESKIKSTMLSPGENLSAYLYGTDKGAFKVIIDDKGEVFMIEYYIILKDKDKDKGNGGILFFKKENRDIILYSLHRNHRYE